MKWLWPNKARINTRRLELGLSQDALSKSARVGKTTIERLLGNKKHRGTHTTFSRIANALELSVKEITLQNSPQKTQKKSARQGASGICLSPGTGLPQGLSEFLIGRENELSLLNKAWTEPSIHLFCINGIGGSGKTSLLNHWLDHKLSSKHDVNSVFTWSFSGQGGSYYDSVTDNFINQAWRWFCPGLTMPNHWKQRTQTLAEKISANRNLLILDGLEVFQNPPGEDAGRLSPDEPLLNLLTILSRSNRGLCLITSRIQLDDFESNRQNTVPQLALAPLSTVTGSSLLQTLGVTGSELELELSVNKLWGHPLSLVILSRYLTQLDPAGNINRWSCDFMQNADSLVNGQAQQIIAQYEHWLGDTAKVSVLRLLSLFDSSVELGMIEIFRQPPVINKMSDKMLTLNDEEWMILLSDLARNGLINFIQTHDDLRLELHPVVRSYFRQRVRILPDKVWSDTHTRLYYHALSNCVDNPTTYDELIPLYKVVRYGCEAGLYEQVFNDVVWVRILQGFPALSVHKFNAGDTEMKAVSWFFKGGIVKPDQCLIQHTNTQILGRLLWWAGLVYRLTGLISEAIVLFSRAEQEFHSANDVVGEAAAIAYISRCQFFNGQMTDMLKNARRAADIVETDLDYFADKFLASRNIGPVLRSAMSLASKVRPGKIPIFQRLVLFPVADALHHVGLIDESLAMFKMCYSSKLPLAMSSWDIFVGQDSMYYDLLFTLGEIDQARNYAEQRLKSLSKSPMLSALMHTVLIRADARELEDSSCIIQLESGFIKYGEALDYRVNYHYIRGLLELASSSQRLHEYELANRIIERASQLISSINMGLLRVEVMIAKAAQAFDLGDAHMALSQASQALTLIERDGYTLRKKAAQKIVSRIQELEE